MIKLPKDELDFLKKGEDVNDSKKDGKFSIFLIFSFFIELVIDKEPTQISCY